MNKLVVATGMGFDVSTVDQIKILHEIGWEGVFTDVYAEFCFIVKSSAVAGAFKERLIENQGNTG